MLFGVQDTFQAGSVLTGRQQRMQRSRVWSGGSVLTLLHIFLAFLFFEEKTIGGNSGKFGTSVCKNTDSNCLGELIKGNRF